MQGLVGLCDLHIFKGPSKATALLPGAGGRQLFLEAPGHPALVPESIEVQQVDAPERSGAARQAC